MNELPARKLFFIIILCLYNFGIVACWGGIYIIFVNTSVFSIAVTTLLLSVLIVLASFLTIIIGRYDYLLFTKGFEAMFNKYSKTDNSLEKG